jgi:outer membrane protein assembly factor BamA
MIFDKDVLQDERLRIENLLKEEGYFRFSKEYVFYQADEVDAPERTFDLTMRIEDFIEGTIESGMDFIPHPKYTLGNIYIYPNMTAPEDDLSTAVSQAYDTVAYDGQYYLYKGKRNLKPSVIANVSYLIPQQYYRLSDVNRTYRNLSALGMVRYTNIAFVEKDRNADMNGQNLLDCHIELTQKKIQSYQIEPVGTITDGDMGVRGNLLYQNLNLFRGAEIFNLGFTGAIEALKNRTNKKFSSMKEIGVETSIVFPKFLSPFRLEGFVRRYSPRTSIAASYNYQSRPDYTRSIANASFSYKWNASQYVTHTFWPFELNYVQIYEDRSDRNFIDSVQNTPIGYSFEDHMVNTAGYSLELNNQQIGQSRDFIYLRLNLETAGNFVNVFHNVFSGNEEDFPRQVLNVPYFQYLRGDVDLRYYNIMNTRNSLVYRFYLGMGYSYGNSVALPYEKKFFSGGPNSLRAWSTRDLGPGSYVESASDTSIFNYANKTGDIKFEANLEYRFKLVWKMEGALFLDAGNIWALRKEENRINADFKWSRFYKEIAVGTGFGVRFDFSFFVLRFDFGLKLHDPALPEHERWIPVLKDFALSDLHLKFGIGYPF